jgi:hypothetical protein
MCGVNGSCGVQSRERNRGAKEMKGRLTDFRNR